MGISAEGCRFYDGSKGPVRFTRGRSSGHAGHDISGHPIWPNAQNKTLFCPYKSEIVAVSFQSARGKYIKARLLEGSHAGHLWLVQHMKEIYVAPGQTVDAAAPIGIEGWTGSTSSENENDTSGSHAHIELYATDGVTTINPDPITGFSNDTAQGTYQNNYVVNSSGNPGGEEVSEDTMNQHRAALQAKQGELAHLNAVVLPNAQRGRDDAVGLYENNRRQQTIAEAEVAKTESNANNLKARMAVWLEELRSFVAALFGAVRTQVLGSIEALRKRIAAKLEAIHKRLEEMQSPITGRFDGVEQAAEDLFGLHRTGALEAEEYDEKELPAPQYDGRALEALEYDVNAKTHLQ